MHKLKTTTYLLFLVGMLLSFPVIAQDIHIKAWVEIPQSSLVFNEDTKNGELVKLIQQYHLLKKDSLEALPRRISLLREISSKASQLTESSDRPEQKKKIKKLGNLAKKKAWYLENLLNIYNDYIKDQNASFVPFLTKPGSSDLQLVNKVLYDLKLPSAWGLYWLEAIDPCHRLMLTPYYLKWQESGSSVPFFLWLETEEVPYYSPQVSYCDLKSLSQHQISVSSDDHLLYDSSGKLVNVTDPNTEHLYALTLDKKLFVIEGSDSVRHSTITLGKPVIGAGSIKIRAGELIYIDVESGHYQPSPHSLLKTIRSLESIGLNLDYDNVQVKYYTQEGTVEELLVDFLKKFDHQKHDINKQLTPLNFNF